MNDAPTLTGTLTGMAAGDTTQGNRRDDGTPVHELAPGEYAFASAERTPATVLWICLPSGQFGHIDPARWTVTVEDDGTVTVSPSILDAPDGWHGYLECGVWREV